MEQRNNIIRLLAAALVGMALPAIGAEKIPFDPTRGLVEVPVVIDGRVKGTFGIDTGADRLYIDSTFAHEHHLNFMNTGRQRPVVGMDGTSAASTVDLRSLRVGEEALYNLRATAIDLTQIIKDRRFGMPDGLIGHEVLKRFYVTVDFPERWIKLEVGRPDFVEQAEGRLPPHVPFTTNRHLVLVEVTVNDSITVPMFLDYCASYTVLSPSLAERIGLDPEPDEAQTVPSLSIGGLIATEEVPVITADFSQFKKSLRRADFEGVLGASFLYPHRLTIDYKAERIYIVTR